MRMASSPTRTIRAPQATWDGIDKIAKERGVKPNALAASVLRDFVSPPVIHVAGLPLGNIKPPMQKASKGSKGRWKL